MKKILSTAGIVLICACFILGVVFIFGFDWVFVVACGLVLAALGFGVAVGLGTRKQLFSGDS